MDRLMREDFEKWAKEYSKEDDVPWLPLEMENDGLCYDDNKTFSAWEAWQAACEQRNKDTYAESDMGEGPAVKAASHGTSTQKSEMTMTLCNADIPSPVMTCYHCGKPLDDCPGDCRSKT
jgi:hypothetical protein